MQRSDSIGKLAAALAKAQGEMDNADKDSSNPHFRSKYADLAAVRAAIREPFSKNGLAYVQLPRFNGEAVEVETVLMHAESGEFIADTLSIPIAKKDAHGIGSAVTYARRFSLMAVAGIAPSEDDDGNAASERPRHQAAPAKPTTQEKAVSQQPPNYAEHVAAEAKAAVNNARQTAAATATVAKMAADAAAPDDWRARERAKMDARAANAKCGEEIKNNASLEARGNLKFHLEKIRPDAPDARKRLEDWLRLAKAAKINMTPADQIAITGDYNLKLSEIAKAETALAAAFRPGVDDPMPAHDAETGELAE